MANQAIDWNFQRNIQFLEDYLQIDPATISAASREIALAHVSTKPGSTLEQLLQLTKDKIPADDIFAMIAANSLTLTCGRHRSRNRRELKSSRVRTRPQS